MPPPASVDIIPYKIEKPMMDTSVPSVEVPQGRFSRLVGVDGRFTGCLRNFFGMYKVVDLDDTTGGIDAYDGPSYMKAVTFQKYGTSTVFRGFVVRWDEGNDNSNEAVDLFYSDDNGSTWSSHEIWAQSGSGISSTTQMDCAVDGAFLIVAVDGKATKTIYWKTNSLVTVDSGPGNFGVELAALTDPDSKSVDSSYQLKGNGTYSVAWRFRDSTRGICSSLSAPLVVTLDITKTTKAIGTISFSSAGGDSGKMVAGDVFTINSRTYEYIDSGSDVTISAASPDTVAGHCQALADAINGDSSATVSARVGATTVLLEAIERGSAGNAYGLSISEVEPNADDISVSGSTLTGGGESTIEPEEHCKAVLDFVANGSVVEGQDFDAFNALFDKVEVFRTINLGASATTGGANYYLEQTLDMPANSGAWDTLQVTIGTVYDESLPFQKMYDPEKDIVDTPPQSGAIGRYQGITFMSQASSVDGGYDTLNSSLEHLSGEYFTTYNKRAGNAEEGRPLRYITAGDSMFILEPNAIVHVFKSTTAKPLIYTVLHKNRGLVGKYAAHAVGNSILMITGTSLMLLNASNGSMGQISAVNRILSVEWKSELADIQSAYDSQLDASFFLDVTQKEMLVIWHSTHMCTLLEGANFVAASETPDITTGNKTRAYFITATGLIVRPDDLDAGSGTMWGLSDSYTLDGTVETASAAKTHVLDSNATFHADMVGALVYFTTGDNAGIGREITGVTAGDLTVSAFPSAIAVGDTYSISPVPFSARFWPLQIEGMISRFRRWVMKGAAIKVKSISGFDDNVNNKWRVGAYRNGGSTLESSTVEIEVNENPAVSAGIFDTPSDGIDIEPYIEQISCGTVFELVATEIPVTLGTSRHVSTS